MIARKIVTIDELHATLCDARRAGGRIGLVPTMGALHGGHESLITRAARECDVVVVTVFVNPTQFSSAQEHRAYPRRIEADLSTATSAGATVLFAPEEKEIYPGGAPEVTVDPGPLGAVLEGAFRPGHFLGVATIVAKLFAITSPKAAYFGEKDFQQLAIVRRLAADLSFPLEVVGCATVRDEDGLALSSRNVYLSPDERTAASALYRALCVGRETIDLRKSPTEAEQAMLAVLKAEPRAAVDYAVCRDATTLSEPEEETVDLRLLVAARFGSTRLIDNIGARR